MYSMTICLDDLMIPHSSIMGLYAVRLEKTSDALVIQIFSLRYPELYKTRA